MADAQTQAATATWADANRAFLDAEIARLRLLFQRKILWLRRVWQRDSNQGMRVITDAECDRLLSGIAAEDEERFYVDDADARELTGRLATLGREKDRLAALCGKPALQLLMELFRLTPFERDVVLLCLAAEHDPGIATLCGYVHDDARACYPTFRAAEALFCFTRPEHEAARRAMMPVSQLRRFRLITLSETPAGAARTLRSLLLDERIADYLTGVNHIDEAVAQMVRPVPASALGPQQSATVEGLVRWAQSMPPAEPWPVIQLTGPAGAGKRSLAREFCARVGLTLYALDPRRVPASEGTEQAVMHAIVERETLLSRMATYIDLSDVESGDRLTVAAVADWIERAGGVLFVAGREPWRLQRRSIHIPVARPGAADQRQIWNHHLERLGQTVNGQVEAIVQQFDFGPEAIARVVQSAAGAARRRDAASEISESDLWGACREQAGWRPGTLAQKLNPAWTWEDIVLPEDVLRQLREIADQVSARAQVYGQWDFGSRLARGRGISVLFAGPSGTGKTMAAEILATHLRLDLYRIDLAGVVSKYIGETEKNLREVFDAAEQSGAILLFDEADSLFGKRTEVKDSHDRYANIETNYLLQRMEDYRGLAILCTNRRTALDRAFLRRLRFLVDFPFPDGAHRRQIWSRVFPAKAPVAALDLDALSRMDITGANIRNIALNAAFLAAADNAEIGMGHVLHAARREYAKIDKLPSEAEFGACHRGVRA